MGFALRRVWSEATVLPDIAIAYQPVFDIENGSVFAYEALVRGRADESADVILHQIDADNRTAFDRRVCAMAVEQAAALGIGETDASLLINMTPTTALDIVRSLPTTVEAAGRAGLAHHRIVFELTEHTKLDLRQAYAIVQAYRAHGFRTALDDFGAGYAGLVKLAELPTDLVKIDMGLVRNIDSHAERRMIVAGMIKVLAELGRLVVAEGVETAGELATVRDLGLRLVQGFYLGRPSRTGLQREPDNIASFPH